MDLDESKLEKAAYVLKTISHPIRLAIILLLDENEELAVNEICLRTKCEQSLVSHHLNNMRLKGILNSRKVAQYVYYSLKNKNITKIFDCIKAEDCAFDK